MTTLEDIRGDGEDAARRGYTLAHNPYRTATVDRYGTPHPRPMGFEEKGDAWEEGYSRAR